MKPTAAATSCSSIPLLQLMLCLTYPSIQWRYSPDRALASSKDSLPRHLLRFRNNEVLRCEVVNLTTNPR
jgi:hypothetical protein